jgi:hypothetical protein
VFGNLRVPVYLQACNQGAQILQEIQKPSQILGARTVTYSKFRTKDPQILGASIQKLVAVATGPTDFVHSCQLSFCSFSASPNSCGL